MNYVTQIIASFKASAVQKVLVIDDAYDPPTLEERHQGELLEVLQGPKLREYVTDDVLEQANLQSAIKALEEGEFDHEAVFEAISSLFEVYRRRRVADLDPYGQFARLKKLSLESLDPLLELLGRCGEGLCIRPVGKDAALSVSREWSPDLILMDYFLSPADSTAGALTTEQADAATKSSIDLLRSILKESKEVPPAVILMSSQDVGARAQWYRSSLDGKVIALRFGFLNKKWIRGEGGALIAEGYAADVLMETSGSFDFGRTLETALGQWKAGAEAGIGELYKELRDLDVKDFAYLLRFRLYDEGEPFADYLEWFLGESLRAVVDNQVRWNTKEFARLNEKELTEAIEGALPVPPSRIAQFFDRLRFNSRHYRVRRRYGLGDLFIGPDKRSVRMVITPDSDIIVRNDERNAERLLTVGGRIKDLGDATGLAGDLIFHGTPKALTWDLKDLMSHDFANDTSQLQVNGKAFSYHATMRPLAAQAVQKKVLGDLARVGSAVPPTVNVVGQVRVYLRKKLGSRPDMTELEDLEEAHAQVFMARGGSDGKVRALFTSRFVRTLAARLEGIDDADLVPEDRTHRNNWIGNAAKVRNAMLRVGIRLPGEGIFKMFASLGARDGQKRNWLEIEVDVSDAALIDVQGTDPLAI